MLFYNFANQMYNISVRNHVNFKSLVSWLGLDINNLAIKQDDAIKILKYKNQLSLENLNKLLDYIKDDISSYGNSKFFKVKSITLNNELLEEINYNYYYQTQDDFIPSVSESEINEHININIDEVKKDLITDAKLIEQTEINLESSKEIFISETIKTEEELTSELYSVDNNNIEVSLKVQNELNNNQIKEKDDNGFEWF
jgi:hypothetical protein